MKKLRFLMKALWHIFAVIGVLATALVICLNLLDVNIDIQPDYEKVLCERVDLLRQANSYKTDTLHFNIHSIPDSLKAQEIRVYFNLDSIIGNSSTTWDKTLRLAQFVAQNIPHANQAKEPEMRNAIALWKYTKNIEPAFNCRLHSILLFELLNASGISASYITCMPKDSTDNDCHVVNQVWLPELKKWAMIDSDSGGRYATDKSGIPLSLAEIRDKYISGDAIFYHNSFSKGSDEIDWYYAYMAKNTYWFSCWEKIQFDQESGRKNPCPGRYIHLVPKDYSPFRVNDSDVITSDAGQFWAKPSNAI